jgi:predicted metal-binding protein
MQRLQKYVRKAKSMGVTRAKIIDPESVVVASWVRLKCQFGCPGYGKRRTCPPFSPTPELTGSMLHEYSAALLMQIEDIPPAEESRKSRALKRIVADLEREIFLDGYYKAFGMASGPCRFCKSCDLTEPCRYPYGARPSMEACGIDVYQTARNNGFVLEVVRTEASPCSYLSLILIE